MWLNIDPRLSTPVYQQLVDEIKEAIALGIMAPGERMPTVRDMATELALNPNTVAKAYQKLEQEGIIITMRSRGTFVAERSSADSSLAKKKLNEQIEKVLIEAYHLGLNREEIEQLFAESLEKWEKRGGK
ncbi:MAG: GntR family transcriptional regulator [Syntrophomonadaceae bacterium]|nr:GntR family transcriptional regulator [Syntrophomonadaceae bacterium]